MPVMGACGDDHGACAQHPRKALTLALDRADGRKRPAGAD